MSAGAEAADRIGEEAMQALPAFGARERHELAQRGWVTLDASAALDRGADAIERWLEHLGNALC